MRLIFLKTFSIFLPIFISGVKSFQTREIESGFLTYNEAIQLARNTCKRVDDITSILNNRLSKMFGLSNMINQLELPIPKDILDPFGLITFINNVGNNFQNYVRRTNFRSPGRKRDTSFITIREFIALLKYPCSQLDLKQSLLNSKFINWLNIGNWPTLLIDHNAPELNLLAVPKVWFKAVFRRRNRTMKNINK